MNKNSPDIYENTEALDINGNTVHISNAESGKRGYYCRGCGCEMQAVKFKIENHNSYFRHDPTAVKKSGRCTYLDETHRHRIAKEILQRLKKIKVPSVLKYPPESDNPYLVANVLKKAEVLQAAEVRNELTFYENGEGEILWGRNPDVNERYLLIKPDVTFFNEQRKPVLLIEIVATHGIKPEKQAKIKRLGINTIQVRIPPCAPEDIEKIFSRTDNTKWVYNHVEENTRYVPVSQTDSSGISEIDVEQRRLLEESFLCRQFQIKDLIRRIEECLGSELYRTTERTIRQELSRVKNNTESAQDRLDDLQRDAIREIRNELEPEEAAVKAEEQRFEDKSGELEGRYTGKREELIEKTREVEARIRQYEGTGDSEGAEFERRRSFIRIDQAGIRDDIKRERGRIEEIQRDRDDLPAREARIRKHLTSSTKKAEQEEGRIICHLEIEEESLPGIFERDRAELEARYAKCRKQVLERIKTGDTKGGDELSSRIAQLVRAREFFATFLERDHTLKRYRTALRCISEKTYKNWPQ